MNNEIDNMTANGSADSEQTYTVIRNSVITAQSKIYTAVNSAMVQAYWEIGEQIYLACGENDHAEYGKGAVEVSFRKADSGIRKRLYCCKSTQYAAVLSDISKTLHTV